MKRVSRLTNCWTQFAGKWIKLCANYSKSTERCSISNFEMYIYQSLKCQELSSTENVRKFLKLAVGKFFGNFLREILFLVHFWWILIQNSLFLAIHLIHFLVLFGLCMPIFSFSPGSVSVLLLFVLFPPSFGNASFSHIFPFQFLHSSVVHIFPCLPHLVTFSLDVCSIASHYSISISLFNRQFYAYVTI